MKMLASLFLALALTTAACDDDDHDDGGHEAIPECDEIGEACHESPSTEGQLCHTNAHEAWSKDECIANRERCLTLCAGELIDGGAAEIDAGAPDATSTASFAP